MLSVASLLNPVKPESRGTPLPSSPSPSLCTSSSTQGSPKPSTQLSIKKPKMSKDGAIFAKGKIKGDVNYAPFEDLNEETIREVGKFQVYPLGKIQEYARHIPYNSEKKNFLEKTGRESFEVFQYIFKVPGDDKDYTVMWDYNIGLVRITPFFKCCKYSKTTPAKMLYLNPGLKDITHSITGGALAAQGYWMPFSCALQVCATFCAHIAPALVPIFGPDFPSLCVPVEAPEYSRMIIPSTTVKTATAEAEAYRLQYNNSIIQGGNYTHTPQTAEGTPPSLGRRLRLKRTYGGASAYRSPVDTDIETAGSEASSGDGYFNSPVTPSSSISLSQPQDWRSTNSSSHSANSSINIGSSTNAYKAQNPNPILSAIPRSVDINMVSTLESMVPIGSQSLWRSKRSAEDVTMSTNGDEDYDGEESSTSIGGDERSEGDREMDPSSNEPSSAEKKAAWLLMNLSVKDRESNAVDPDCDGDLDEEFMEGPPVKRRRATSM